MSWTYADVDRSADPARAVMWQERANRWPQVQAYKAAVAAELPDPGLVLDVGCGPGFDLAALGPERSVGVDPSWIMCRRARHGGPDTGAARSVRVIRGDGHRLPFADDSFAGCRADRVLQHLAAPDTALDEMVRVTRPGGRVVVADADQESVVIHLPGVPTGMLDRVKALRRDVGYRNGRLASQLPARMRARGLARVRVRVFPLLLTNPDEAFGLPDWPRLWRDRGAGHFSDEELARWAAAVERARPNGLVYVVVYFVVAGTVT